MWMQLLNEVTKGSARSLARCISLVENEVTGYEELLQSLPVSTVPVIGITGPPGAGKSTLADALMELMVQHQKKIIVLCVDPSSPFHLGALLGDRIRMSEWYNHPNVFIRSLATRGSLGGLHPKIIEITDVCKAAPVDVVIIETVGVGQSEVEIAGLADVTVVVTVPEAGDEVQTMKAGLMEIADVFVVNKADRPEADLFVRNLRLMLAPAFNEQRFEIPIIKTIATGKKGIDELWTKLQEHLALKHTNKRKNWLLAEKAFQLIQKKRMKDVQKEELEKKIETLYAKSQFNLYRLINEY